MEHILEKMNSWINEERESTEVVKKFVKYINNNFKLFSSLGAIFFSIGFVLIKSMAYSYELGKMYVNNIEKRYINLSQENFLFQLLYISAILIVFGIINYLYYSVATYKRHKRRRLLIFWIVEVILFLILSMLLSNIGILEFAREFWNSDIRDKFAIALEVILVCCMINTIGIVCAIDHNHSVKKDSKKPTKSEKSDDSKQQVDNDKKRVIKRGAISLIIVFAAELVISSLCGIVSENNKSNYKILFVERTSDISSMNECTFSLDGKVGEIYPIVYENDEVYIMCKLSKKDGEIEIDHSYQKVVEKKNLETRYFIDIYDEKNWK